MYEPKAQKQNLASGEELQEEVYLLTHVFLTEHNG